MCGVVFVVYVVAVWLVSFTALVADAVTVVVSRLSC